MPEGRRQYSRVAVHIPAVIQVPGRTRSNGRRIPSQRIHAQITSLSPGGLRLETDGDELPLGASAHLSLTFTIEGELMSLPVALLWCRRNDGDVSDFGGRLLLEVSDAASRQRYAHWIVSRLTAQPRAQAH